MEHGARLMGGMRDRGRPPTRCHVGVQPRLEGGGALFGNVWDAVLLNRYSLSLLESPASRPRL